MDEVRKVLSMMTEMGLNGITTDISKADRKLLVLTKANISKNRYALSSISENSVIFAECEIKEKLNCKALVSDNFRENYAKISKEFFGNVSDKMRFIFVTGTNGKSSTVAFISQIFSKLDIDVCTIGTRGVSYKNFEEDFSMTTPDPHVLHYYLKKVYEMGCRIVVMEASAHAIALKKLYGIKADVATLTNIARDHLDYFKTESRYIAAKRELFSNLYAKHFVLRNNYSYFVENEDKSNVFLYSFEDEENFSTSNFRSYVIVNIEPNNGFATFDVCIRDKKYSVENKNILGDFNIENMISAALSVVAFGFSEDDVMKTLNTLEPISGRLEKIENDRGLDIYVDFAHTPAALESVLKTLKSLCNKGRLICVFGTGGDRDKGKRAVMGAVSSKYSDLTIITSDNPRSEDPRSITQDILQGVLNIGGKYIVIPNRSEAIEHSIKIARSGDTIIIAGKGEESYIEINGKKIPYSDKEQIKRVLKK